MSGQVFHKSVAYDILPMPEGTSYDVLMAEASARIAAQPSSNRSNNDRRVWIMFATLVVWYAPDEQNVAFRLPNFPVGKSPLKNLADTALKEVCSKQLLKIMMAVATADHTGGRTNSTIPEGAAWVTREKVIKK